MTSPEHFRAAEELLEHAASMLEADVAVEDRVELVQRQAATASMAIAPWPADGAPRSVRRASLLGLLDLS
jgi:hypothetical protein